MLSVGALKTCGLRMQKHVGLVVSAVALLLANVLCHGWIVQVVQLVSWVFFALFVADFALCQWQLHSLAHGQQIQPISKDSTITKYALITGASQGIGKEMAFLLAQRKLNLVLAARSEKLLQQLQQGIEQKHHVHVLLCVCDLATDQGIDQLLQFVQQNNPTEKQLHIELLINNVGASVYGAFVDLPHAKVDQLLTLNMVTLTRLCHGILPQMVQRKSGKVLNISSMAASSPNPLAAIYGASKAYVTSFSLALNYELRNSGVTVTCFCPGPVASQFGTSAGCEQALYMNVPGAVNSSQQCAEDAIQSLFDNDELAFDTPITRLISFVLLHIFPWRLELMIANCSMTNPRDWFGKQAADKKTK